MTFLIPQGILVVVLVFLFFFLYLKRDRGGRVQHGRLDKRGEARRGMARQGKKGSPVWNVEHDS